MQNLPMLLLVLASFAEPVALAAGAEVDITSPADGARLDAKAQNKIAYDAALGGDGDHVHVYVDGRQVALLRQRRGTYTLDPLARGNREICVKIVNKNHTPIGVERCVKLMVE
ncbi:MAG: hypothetical protein EPN14_00005 [Gallionella sp.]|nr:MAG: hypothetical protein EPN14_00005 [Gallionella sp.]